MICSEEGAGMYNCKKLALSFGQKEQENTRNAT